MASSKLLKEAIADAKAVRETAIANAKIALEEAFTPRLQSILSRKLQAEMEDEDEAPEVNEENDASSEIGNGDNKEPNDKANDAYTDLSGISKETGEPGDELEDYEEVDDLMEGEDDAEVAAEEPAMEEEEMEADEDELDLEAIIRELEGEMDSDEESHEDEPMAEEEGEDEHSAEDAAEDAAEYTEGEDEAGDDEEIDLDEILREMGYGDDEEVNEEEGEDDEKHAAMEAKIAELQSELGEAYSTVSTLKKTINEVNLLNAKLLYTNKLFRNYNLTNEQKVKVVENLDRTTSVREVKLVYATLSESMKFTGTERKAAQVKKNITEGLASKPSASTAPKKEIISENTNELANRFKQLAGIVKK